MGSEAFRKLNDLLLLLGLCVSCTAMVGFPTDARSAEELMEEVVVTATRVPQPSSDVTAAQTTLTRDYILATPFRGGDQLDDLLRYVPGVQPSNLASRYNHPTAQFLSLQGLGTRRALVLLDGVPLNDGFGGWINWGKIPDAVERIEVVPGGGSSLYGTWAMGGVVQILTQQPDTGARFRMESGAGNLSTYRQSLTTGYGTDRVGLILGYRWYHTNGFITVPPYQRGPVDRGDDSRHENFNGTVAVDLSPDTKLTISGGLFREDRSFGTPLSLSNRTIGSVAAGLDGETRQGWHWETKLFAQWETFRNLTSRITPTAAIRTSEVRDTIQVIPHDDFGGLGQLMLPVDARNRLVIGTDARAIIGQSEEAIFPTGAGPVGHTLARGKQVGGGLFGEWIARPTDRFTMVPSFRWDWWRNFDGHVVAQTGAETTPRDRTATVVNPKLAFQYQLSPTLRSAVSVYQAFRAPTLNELYRGFTFSGFRFLANENLSPERLTGGDAKIEADLAKRRLRLRVSGHYDEVKDQIVFISEGPSAARRENVGRARSTGGGAELKLLATAHLSFQAGYAYTDAVIKSFPADKTREGRQIPMVSRHQVVAGFTVAYPQWVEVTLLARYLSRQFADDLNTQPIADFVVLDASVKKKLGAGMRLFLDLENLTDRQYIATQTGAIKTLGAPFLVLGGVTIEY
jgi:iron complex outermembrane receptor protein